MNQEAPTSRICITRPNVRTSHAHESCVTYIYIFIAKKDDNPEDALKEFRAIVDQEEEQGDWYGPTLL